MSQARLECLRLGRDCLKYPPPTPPFPPPATTASLLLRLSRACVLAKLCNPIGIPKEWELSENLENGCCITPKSRTTPDWNSAYLEFIPRYGVGPGTRPGARADFRAPSSPQLIHPSSLGQCDSFSSLPAENRPPDPGARPFYPWSHNSEFDFCIKEDFCRSAAAVADSIWELLTCLWRQLYASNRDCHLLMFFFLYR